MGFISSATSLTLIAKLTPYGREKLITNNNSLIKYFSLGDSDANYNIPIPLTTGEVPSISGNIGPDSSVSNSTAKKTNLKSQLIVNPSGALTKSVDVQSINVTTEEVYNGFTTISGSSLTINYINRADSSDSLANLFYSFGLPLNAIDDNKFTGLTFNSGGYSNTALSGLAQSDIVTIALDDTTYGECLDGKSIKIEFPTSAGTYTIYSTFQNKNQNKSIEDANYTETSSTTTFLGSNIALLFSDDIATPNGNSPSLSWSTGYNTVKPFSVNQKELYNLQTNTNLGQTADTVVGVVYLDKGIIVLTEPSIVNNFDAFSSGTTVSFNSVSTKVYQNITCLANRGEFGGSINTTFTGSDTPRISEVGLYDSSGGLIAFAKTDRQLLKNINEMFALNIKIQL
jgi:hypothetical protein